MANLVIMVVMCELILMSLAYMPRWYGHISIYKNTLYCFKKLFSFFVIAAKRANLITDISMINNQPHRLPNKLTHYLKKFEKMYIVRNTINCDRDQYYTWEVSYELRTWKFTYLTHLHYKSKAFFARFKPYNYW